jgi:hypothetical protein
MNKIREIIESWKIAYNPNDTQSELASERILICNSCEFKADKPIKHCMTCGCPLVGKVYSPSKNSCPKQKWVSVDNKFIKE